MSLRVNAKLTKNMPSTYVSACYPFADREILAELTYFVCRMFLVDDDYEEAKFNSLWSEALKNVESICSIAGTANGDEKRNTKPVEAFRAFGKCMRQRYTVGL